MTVLHQREPDMQNNHRWTCMELAGPASHMFDSVNKTLRLLWEAQLWTGDLLETLVSLEMLKYFWNFLSVESCGIGTINENGATLEEVFERRGVVSLSRTEPFCGVRPGHLHTSANAFKTFWKKSYGVTVGLQNLIVAPLEQRITPLYLLGWYSSKDLLSEETHTWTSNRPLRHGQAMGLESAKA